MNKEIRMSDLRNIPLSELMKQNTPQNICEYCGIPLKDDMSDAVLVNHSAYGIWVHKDCKQPKPVVAPVVA